MFMILVTYCILEDIYMNLCMQTFTDLQKSKSALYFVVWASILNQYSSCRVPLNLSHKPHFSLLSRTFNPVLLLPRLQLGDSTNLFRREEPRKASERLLSSFPTAITVLPSFSFSLSLPLGCTVWTQLYRVLVWIRARWRMVIMLSGGFSVLYNWSRHTTTFTHDSSGSLMVTEVELFYSDLRLQA